MGFSRVLAVLGNTSVHWGLCVRSLNQGGGHKADGILKSIKAIPFYLFFFDLVLMTSLEAVTLKKRRHYWRR